MIKRSLFRWLRHFLPVLAMLTSAAFGADFTGKVLTPDGKPVKGATVYYVELPIRRSGSADLPTTRTDDEGTFHFPHHQAGEAEFIADADSFGLSSTQPNGIAPLQIRLRPRTDLTLTLLTADNKTAANVRVSVRQINLPMRMSEGVTYNLWIPVNYRSPWSATTDASGVCAIPGLPQGGRVTLSVDDERYADPSYSDSVQLSGSAQTQGRPIQLQLAATISGKVLYESTSQPAVGLGVEARANSDQHEAFTGADGSFVFNRLRADQYDICVNAGRELQKSWTAATGEHLAIAAGETKANVNFTLIPGVVLSGKVLSADDSKPVAGVSIGIYGPSHPRNGGMPQSVSTDADGSFSVRVPRGAQNVYIMSDTPANGFGKPLDDEKDVTIPAGGTASVEFRLPRAAMFAEKGKVIDPDGKPVANASVYIYFEERTNVFSQNQVVTDADGIFQTAPILGTAEIAIRAKFQDMATPKAVVVHRRDSGDLVIQLQKNGLGTVSGRVLDQDGKPLKDAQIELLYTIGRYQFGENGTACDDEGNYKIESLWPDLDYRVEAYHDGYGLAESNAGLRVGPGQSTNIPDLTIYKRDSAIAGVLLDRDDKPVSGQRIFVRGARTGYSNLTTDASGKFQCAVVGNDRLTISYNFHTNRQKQQSVNGGDQNIVLHTAPPVVVAARIAPAPPPPVVVAAPAPPPPVVAPTPEPPPTVFDPADAVTWNGWLYAIILVLVGGVVTVIANAIAAIRGRGRVA